MTTSAPASASATAAAPITPTGARDHSDLTVEPESIQHCHIEGLPGSVGLTRSWAPGSTPHSNEGTTI
jgi:hypothetical protein